MNENNKKYNDLFMKLKNEQKEKEKILSEKNLIEKNYNDIINQKQNEMNKIKQETENYSLQINIKEKEKLELNNKINELTNNLNQKEEEISNIKNINNQNEKVFNAKVQTIEKNYKNKFDEEFAKLKKTLIKSLGDNLKQLKNKYNEQYSKREKSFDDKFNELNNSIMNTKLNLNNENNQFQFGQPLTKGNENKFLLNKDNNTKYPNNNLINQQKEQNQMNNIMNNNNNINNQIYNQNMNMFNDQNRINNNFNNNMLHINNINDINNVNYNNNIYNNKNNLNSIINNPPENKVEKIFTNAGSEVNNNNINNNNDNNNIINNNNNNNIINNNSNNNDPQNNKDEKIDIIANNESVIKPKENEIIKDDEQYLYDCTNSMYLSVYIYQGTEDANFEIYLRNIGDKPWAKDSKLKIDKASDCTTDEIILAPQNPNEERSYKVTVKDLQNYPAGDYRIIFLFWSGGKTNGEKIEAIIKIKEKDDKKNEIEENISKIEEFRDMFNLTEDEYPNDKILEILKENDFNYENAFTSLFN